MQSCGEARLVFKVATCPAYLRQAVIPKPESEERPPQEFALRPETPSTPVSLATTWSRTLAVSSGKVIASATQAATPAEKILTAMVGCTSEVVGPIILTQVAERGDGVEGEGLQPQGWRFCLPLLSPVGGSCRPALSVPQEAGAAGSLGGPRAQEAGGAQEWGRAWRRLLLHPRAPGAPAAPRLAAPRHLPSARDFCSWPFGAEPRQVSEERGVGPAGACPGRWVPPTRILAWRLGSRPSPQKHSLRT